MEQLSFDQLGLSSTIVGNLQKIGYETPTQIQEKSIPILLTGQDLLGQAQTGTGKTAAFALPLLNNIDIKNRDPQVLVLAPTRELAVQVSEAFSTYAEGMKGFYGVPIYGGQSMTNQLRDLKRGAQVVVGTPGRVMDHIRRKTLRLDNIQTIVLDEADEMLKMGFVEDIEWILSQAPEEKQVALFSATMPTAIKRIAKKHQNDAQEIKIKTKTSTVESINQLYWNARGVKKIDALIRLLEVQETDATIIFVRTKSATLEVAERLEACGHSCAALNGDLNQSLRERTIDRLKKGDLDIIVATDVAARGIDVERVSHVINYDIPYDTEAYVHRIGRTGRAGRSGTAILFVSNKEMRLLKAIEKTTRQKIKELELPTKEAVTASRVKRYKTNLATVLEKQDLSFYKNIIGEFVSENDVDIDDAAAALCYLSQKDSPFIVKEKAVRSSDRDSRSSRDGRSGRDRRGRDGRGKSERNSSSERMDTYRISVGRTQGINPGNIVGAIAGETDISARRIGHIKLHDAYSTVELPSSASGVLRQLQGVQINNHAIQVEKTSASSSGSSRGDDRRGRSSDSRSSGRDSRGGRGEKRLSGRSSKPRSGKGKSHRKGAPRKRK